MNRIRYTKNGENRLVSVKSFNHETNGARYKVVLELTNSEWFVLDSDSGTVVKKGQETSFHSLKIAAKTALTELGISFTTENRKKKEVQAVAQAS